MTRIPRNDRNFALIGAAGYVAPRHMRAIRDTGNRLICALDPSDSVGVLDSFSHDISFFTEFERFDRHAEKLRRAGESKRFHYVSICSPNYLHDAHIRFALRIGADAICEKPLVLNPWNLDALATIEEETGNRIFNVLQLRMHPSLLALKASIDEAERHSKCEIDLTYIASRGRWYRQSWKGDTNKSGGVATNIGIHFFDMLLWIFGECLHSEVHIADRPKMSGFLELEKARVRWFLSVDRDDLPLSVQQDGKPTFRSITCDGEEIEFSEGFGDLHTMVYQDIMNGGGFGIDSARDAIDLAYRIRHSSPVVGDTDRVHPFALPHRDAQAATNA